MESCVEESVSDRARVLRALATADWTASAAAFDAGALAEAGIELVKTGDCRAVYRVDAPEGAIYLKHSWSRGWVARLWDRLRGSAPRREFLRSREAERRGIPTTRPLAFAEATHAGACDGLLVTRELSGAVPLDRFLDAQAAELRPNSIARAKLVEALAVLCAQTHEAGVEHLDLHAGNIMVVWPAEEAAPRLYLIDLDKARFGQPLGWRATRRNLAMLLCGLHHVAGRRDFWRFWRTYRKHRLLSPKLTGKHAHAIWRRGMDRVFAVLRDRDRRALRDNRQFFVLRRDAGVAFGLRSESISALTQLMRAPDAPLHRPGIEALKVSHSSVVVKTSLPGEEREIVYKRVRGKTWRKRLAALFRPSRARQAWVRGHALLSRGIATARPLFALETASAWRGESYLATEWIDGTENLHLYLWRLAKMPSQERSPRLRHSAVVLGQLLGKMHAYGVSQRDLKGCNLAVVERGECADWYLLDLDGVRFKRRVSLRERAANLSRLAASAEVHPCLSRADRWRFLRAYARAAGLQDDPRTLWRLISAGCAKQLARLERQGRRIA